MTYKSEETKNKNLRKTPFNEFKSILCRVIPRLFQAQAKERSIAQFFRHGQHPRLPHLSRVISLDLRILS